MFIDVHCHLSLCKDEKSVVDRAIKEGVKIIVNDGLDIESNRKSLSYSNKFKEVRTGLGIHPTHIHEMSDKEIFSEIEFIRENSSKISAIGEIGVDLHSGKDIEKQEKMDLFMIHPLITEKAVMSIERDNVLTFIIDKKISKTKMAREIEHLFDVKIEKVRTSNRGSEKVAYVKLKREFLAIDLATKLGII